MAQKNTPNFAPMPGDTLLRSAPKLFLLKDGALDGNKMAGEASGIGNLDCYQDVIFPNAFTAEVLADFLMSGFIADGHDWTKIIGMPMVAEVRGNRLYTECEFHSTPDAQSVKTKCQERLANGKSVGLSIGFGMYPNSYKDFANGTALLAYAKAQNFDMSLFDEEAIKACTSKCRAILHIDKLYEYSPVPVPANPAAWALAVKAMQRFQSGEQIGEATGKELTGISVPPGQGGTLVVTLGEYFPDYVEASMTMSALATLVDYLFYGCFYENVRYSDAPKAERREQMAGGLAEFSAFVLKVFDALTSDDADDEEVETALSAIKTFWPKPDETNPNELSLRAGERFTQTLETARTAVQGATERAQTIATLRQKDNRTLSGAMTTSLTAQRDGLAVCLSTIDSLLAAPLPPPADDTAAAPAPVEVDLPGLHAKNRERSNFLRLLEVETEL